ncbi:MAG TPA: TIGR00725 family protein [Dissulfurispiraceae bacterium]|nr:TIGR00725 family protein [Dissulfurispiraceae bacterium]
MSNDRKIIGVIGAGRADAATEQAAEAVGKLIAHNGALLVCGGLGGVMEAAARGAKSAGGWTVGILPQTNRREANAFIDIPIATGFGEGRNVFIVRSADVLIAVGGEYGTLSEIAFALKSGKPVIGLGTWDIDGIRKAETPKEAVDLALMLA